jgi:hypothetical protein
MSDQVTKAYSLNDEEFRFDDVSDALQALADDGELVEGRHYYEIDCEPRTPADYLSADHILDTCGDQMYDELGECCEDAFTVPPHAVEELNALLATWAAKHLSGRYWLCVGESRELTVTAEDVAEYSDASDRQGMQKTKAPLEGELLLAREQRTHDDRFGVGDYVSRDGNDVHRCVSIREGGDLGDFVCVVAPPIYEGSTVPLTTVGEVETNLTRRYEPVDYKPDIEVPHDA